MIKQQIIRVFTILSLIISLTFCVCNTSYAYTEEEKQQAKAWLSAHGYSPDAGGASQAYADYLNGKFDEELGIDVNGDGIPATTKNSDNTASNEDSTEDSNWEDAEADDDSEKRAKKQMPGSNAVNPENEKNTTPDSADANNDEAVEGEDGTLEINLLGEEEEAEQEDTTALGPAKPAELSKGLITLYRKNRMDTYEEAAEVIGIAFLLTMVLQLLFSLRKKRD